MNISWFTGEAPNGGWFGYPPNSTVQFNPGNGMTYWVLGLNVLGVASIAAGLNFIVTIINMRAPGMSLMKMPVFTWMTFITSILIVLALPVLGVPLYSTLFYAFLLCVKDCFLYVMYSPPTLLGVTRILFDSFMITPPPMSEPVGRILLMVCTCSY